MLTAGTMTIPVMKKSGFRASYAAAIEACASTGAVLAPPVMGATAFVIAQFLNISYAEVAMAAIIPAALYYLGLFMQVDSYAARHGLKGIPRSELPRVIDTIKAGWYYIFVGVLAFLLVALYALLRSKAGLFLQAIRDDEVAAARSGVDVVFWKTAAFALSAAASGFAGALYAHFAELVTPELGLIGQTGLIVSMAVIGGMGTLAGPLIAAFLVYVLSEWLRDVGGYQLVVFSALVVIFARFFREGLWGLARGAMQRWRRS